MWLHSMVLELFGRLFEYASPSDGFLILFRPSHTHGAEQDLDDEAETGSAPSSPLEVLEAPLGGAASVEGGCGDGEETSCSVVAGPRSPAPIAAQPLTVAASLTLNDGVPAEVQRRPKAAVRFVSVRAYLALFSS